MEYNIMKYKNIRETAIDVSNNCLILGDNGSGKTNLTEILEYTLNPTMHLETEQDLGNKTIDESMYINNEVIRIRANRMFRNFNSVEKYSALMPDIELIKSYEVVLCEEYNLYYKGMQKNSMENKSSDITEGDFTVDYEEYVKVILNIFEESQGRHGIANLVEQIVSIVFHQENFRFTSLNDLSDGMKSVVFIVAYLTVVEFESSSGYDIEDMELEKYNSYYEKTNRYCIIDELDLNIHEATLINFYNFLISNFSNWKFIMTTHSPGIVYEVDRNTNIYKLKNGVLEIQDNYFTKSILDVYKDLFGLDIYNRKLTQIYKSLKLNLIKAYNGDLSHDDTDEIRRLLEESQKLDISSNKILVKYYSRLREVIGDA